MMALNSKPLKIIKLILEPWEGWLGGRGSSSWPAAIVSTSRLREPGGERIGPVILLQFNLVT